MARVALKRTTRILAIVALLAMATPLFARVPDDWRSWRALSASHPQALIEDGRSWLDGGRFSTNPDGERELVWWMGHAAVNVSNGAALTEATSRLAALGVTHKDALALAYAGFLRADGMIERGDRSAPAEALRAAAHIQDSTDAAVRALARFQLCDVYAMNGDHERAAPLCRDAYEMFRQRGDEWNLAQAENNEGVVAMNQGHLREAADYFLAAYRRYAALGDHSQSVMAGDNLANVYLKLGRAREALRLSQESLADEAASGRANDALLSRTNIARAKMALGQPREALADIAAAVVDSRHAHDAGFIAPMLVAQSELAEQAGDLKLALKAQREAAEAQELERKAGVEAEEAELSARYATREKEIRIRDLERDNEVKSLLLQSEQEGAKYREDVNGMQRAILLVAMIGLASVAALLGVMWRAQHRNAATLLDQALSDPLTNTENRRAFFQRLQTMLRLHDADTAMRHALLLIDLDHFKRINDSGGHPFGDLVLTAVAQCMTRTLGSRGVLARLGGEEFAALCPCIGGEAALQLAESLRAEVAQLAFPQDGQTVTTTISIGMAMLDGERAYDADSWMRCADAALYTAKSHGRNRVVASALAR